MVPRLGREKRPSSNRPSDSAGSAAAVAAPEELAVAKGRTLRADAWRRLRRNKLAMGALVWLAFIVLVAVTANLWAPRALGDPIFIDTTKAGELSLLPPSTDHLFGTDQMGRDVLCRVIYGAQVSLRIGVLAVVVMLVLGMFLGAIAAYYGGIVDSVIMRLADTFYSFPFILFAIALVAILGPSWINVFLAIGVIGWPSIARVFRSSILSVKENEYVQAARALGASSRRILARHIMPNAMAPVVVIGTMTIGGAILTEAALSFLGMGVQLPNPSWGNMLEEARNYMTLAPWLMVFPGIAILTTVLAFVLLGDGLRDALDVKMKE
jgi:peptide/nickel transport system permease protein/oligopeptide transport system permease protein